MATNKAIVRTPQMERLHYWPKPKRLILAARPFIVNQQEPL